MEESTAQDLMWVMRKREMLKLKSHFQASMKSLVDSWEEKAFAEDAAAGAVGGCIWPPRSYSCSFCRREFRSAQALGGHMNVHRRDRARLKQSLIITQNEAICDQAAENPPQSQSLDHPDSNPRVPASTLSPSRVSADLSTQKNEETVLLHIKEQCKFSSSWSDYSAAKGFLNYNISDSSKPAEELEENPRDDDQDDYSICMGHDHHPGHQVETNLSVGFNSLFCQNQPTGSCAEEAISFKRRKTSIVNSTLPSLVSIDKYDSLQLEVLGLKASTSMEDLDLELRLGHDPPKVK